MSDDSNRLWSSALESLKSDKNNYVIIRKHEFSFSFEPSMYKDGIKNTTLKYLNDNFIGLHSSKYDGFPVAYNDIELSSTSSIDINNGLHVKGIARIILFKPKIGKTFLTKIEDTKCFPRVIGDTCGIKVIIDFAKDDVSSLKYMTSLNVKLEDIKEENGKPLLIACPSWREALSISNRKRSKPLEISIDKDGLDPEEVKKERNRERARLRYYEKKEEILAKMKMDYESKRNSTYYSSSSIKKSRSNSQSRSDSIYDGVELINFLNGKSS